MCAINARLNRAKQIELERVIEPLAGYICANEEPIAVMKSALNCLVNAVAEMNQAARLHAGAIREAR